MAQFHFRRLTQPDAGISVGRKHQFADMAGRLHQAERIADRAEPERAMREWPDRSLAQRRRNFAQQRSCEIRPLNWQLVDVDREIRDVLAQRTQVDAPVEIEIALAEFEKAAERLQHAKTLL